MSSEENISFAEYCDQIKITGPLRRAFETHCRGDSAKFNFRSSAQWDLVRKEFLAADRGGRRTHV